MEENPYVASTVPSELREAIPARSSGLTGRDLFGVIVRALGLAGVMLSVWYFGAFLHIAMGGPELNDGDLSAYAFSSLMLFTPGIFALRFARSVVRFAYPENLDDSAGV